MKRKVISEKEQKLLEFLIANYERHRLFTPQNAYSFFLQNKSLIQRELGIKFDYSFEDFLKRVFSNFYKQIKASESVSKLTFFSYLFDVIKTREMISHNILVRAERGEIENNEAIKTAKELSIEIMKMLQEMAKIVPKHIENVEKTFTPDQIIERITNGGKLALHQRFLFDYLQNESYQRLAISIPPQHGKTTLVLTYIAWLMIRKPGVKVAYISYSQRISEDRCYPLVKFFEFNNLANPDNWKLTNRQIINGSTLNITSIDGTLVGQHFDVVIMDDLYKNYIEANSLVIRNKILQYYRNVVLTRGFENLRIILIGTRWHKDDLIGVLTRGEENFHYIRLPALAEDGDVLGRAKDEPLWPGKHGKSKLIRLRNLYPEMFQTQYQCNPVIRENLVFTGEPQYYSELPSNYVLSIGVDFAFSLNPESDFTAVVILAIEPQSKTYYLINAYRWRATINWTKEKLLRIYQKYKVPLNCEGGGSQKAVIDLLKSSNIVVTEIIPKGDKLTRALIFADAWNSGRFLLPLKAEEDLQEYIEEIKNFTGSNDLHDDFVDATVYAMLKKIGNIEFL